MDWLQGKIIPEQDEVFQAPTDPRIKLRELKETWDAKDEDWSL